ncbi:putative YTH domain-containing protein [Helianthus annuus]|uniref:YTH domain-containing family protein n=1 Tax=Helianthus annuus TaxID=4232 RepID=A0A251U948_HELAN|nr:YTH domain-containing protein ECT4 [Helianthus annuus]KAF5797386.1 putative YTH domain-containing protein [Helianthus annuus]KAJ0549145.1 putative YTH domain-containing protein [Helianthus annuus]KAJ0562090.1 putative YTH domain-containing protein [Helianthus annuus]KAJ0730262.1 putative YTH domain-containing protein [Helianthus annuus]KAJ0906732.1 putative YTH domain-containing protein [Helianthus annuus]
MAAVIPPAADDTAALLKNLSLEISDPVKKLSVDTGNGQIKPSNKVVTPLTLDVMDPSLAYYPNGYPSTAYYYGGYDGTAIDWDDLAHSVYGYGYAPYGTYSQHYQYPNAYIQSPTPTGGSYPAPVTASTVIDQSPLATGTTKGRVGNGVGLKGNTGPALMKPTAYQNSVYKTYGSYGTGAQNGHDLQAKNNGVASKTQNHLMGPNSASGMYTSTEYMDKVYANKFYGQYGNYYGSCYGYGTNGYDFQNNGRGWLSVDNKLKPRVRANGYFGYNNDSIDGLNELNRGPRSRTTKPITTAVKGQNVALSSTDGIKEESKEVKEVNATPDREQYNKTEFPETYSDAKFFIIKSYSEDDVHKSIKYNVCASTQNGNKKLDSAYREAQQKSEACPIFLFFSVNTSGQFVGVAEMVGAVDFNKSLEYWQQDKWIGCFPVKWHIVKDLPNGLLKHIILEYNENKPVTNSRDTQEVKLAQGLQMIKIFKEHSSKQCILDDFEFYEDRQKKIQQKKAKQQQFKKQSWEGKLVTEKKIKDIENEVLKSDDGSDSVTEVKLASNVQDVAAEPKEVEVVVNGAANAC